MDPNNIVVGLIVGLIVGASIGYYFTYTTYSLDIRQLENAIIDAQENLTQMQYDYDKVSSEYNITQDEIINLQNIANQFRNEYTELKFQYENVRDELAQAYQYQIANLTFTSEQMNTSYYVLLTEYNELLADFNMLNAPSSRFSTLNDLRINFTTDRSIYNYTDDISGYISITYENGDPFIGQIEFAVFSSIIPYSGGIFTINGQLNFTLLSPVFKSVPGLYTIKPGWIFDSNGFIIASGMQTDPLKIAVEAK